MQAQVFHMVRMMKSTAPILMLMMIVLASPLWAQASKDSVTARAQKKMIADTSQTKPTQPVEEDTTAKTVTQQTPQGKFRDENVTGIDDRLEKQERGKQKGRDKFIDADGDGICDGRESGLGFQRRGMRGVKSVDGSGNRGKQNRSGGSR